MDTQNKRQLLDMMATKLNNAMLMYLDTCARCGICIDKCHVFASIPEMKNSPVFRAEVVRKLYRKYFKVEGKIAPVLGEATELHDGLWDKIYEAAFSCTGCRRCMVYCPHGIDTQMIMSIAKLLLIGANSEPEILTLLADTSIEKGRSIDILKTSFLEGVQRLEEEVVKKWRIEAGEAAIPVDVEGADLLYVALAGAHSIVPAAAVFNVAKENWTLSFFEATDVMKQQRFSKRSAPRDAP